MTLLVTYPRTQAQQIIDISKSVLTQHNDNSRSGAYLAEIQLTPAAVASGKFGRISSRRVDGTMAAQPLYAHGVSIDGVPKNLLVVVTRQNKVYAINADDPDPNPNGGRIWSRELRDVRGLGAASLPGMEEFQNENGTLKRIGPPSPCGQTHGPVGITSTPVIDPGTSTLYLVFRTGLPPDSDPNHNILGRKNEGYRVESHHWLAAIDLRTGRDVRAPVEIAFPSFDPNMQINRPGLLLLNGVLYVAFGAAVCDHGGNPWLRPWEKPKGHGWVFAYQARDLQRLDAFNTTLHTALAGVWQSGNGLAADSHGNVFAFTGNIGPERYQDVNNEGDQWVIAHDPNHVTELGNSILKLHLGANGKFERPVAHFTAENWLRLDLGDTDLGSGGPALLPNGWVIGGGKQGTLYIINPADMPHARQVFQAFYNTWHPEIHPCDYDKEQSAGPNIHGGPVLWRPEGTTYTWVFGMPEKEYLKAFRAHDSGRVDDFPAMATMEAGLRSPDGMPGAFLSLSANGGRDGILWASVAQQDSPDAQRTRGDIKGRLLAFDALTLKPLWHADDTVSFAKFVPPTVAGGKVFRVAYQDEIIIYGLRDISSPSGNEAGAGRIPPVRPIAASWQNGNHLDLFMISAHRTAVSTFWEGTTGCDWRGWRGWFPVKPTVGPQRDTGPAHPGGPVTALWRDPNHLDLFITSTDGTVLSTFWEASGGWRPWFPISPATGRAAPGQPVTALWHGPGHLDLFITAADGRILSIFWEPSPGHPDGWEGKAWFPISPATGRAAPGQPVTALWHGPGHLDLFITAADGRVLSTFWEPTVDWRPWFGL
jgi:hypothetical protein